MKKSLEIRVPPDKITEATYLEQKVRQKLRLKDHRKIDIVITRRSIDARKVPVLFVLRCDVYIDEKAPTSASPLSLLKDVSGKKAVHIVGAGPAGYFAALKLIENGIKPIIFERGKDVRERRKDLRAIQQFGLVNPESNYCFGEGGAGTYSDGKLYTRSHKRGNIQEILQLLVAHDAKEDILIDAHPHIGSNRLPKIIANIRATILNKGGEIHFNHRITDLQLTGKQVVGLEINNERVEEVEKVILATGHSARDIFDILERNSVRLEPKPFALGIRIEHPQALIDRIQYKSSPRPENLPASSYSLVCQTESAGVFSFCMCPGGLVVPSATAPGELVVNGMSMSRRDSKFANSGIVTSINWEDIPDYHEDGAFAFLNFQQDVEAMMFDEEGQSQKAPGQRMTDFVLGVTSEDLPECSYIPGLRSEPLHEMLPPFVYHRLRTALIQFGKKLNGYLTSEAVVIGIESRTSSPIRIPREPKSKEHVEVKGLYPCGEGAGYAGGIVSAALDGQNVAQAVADNFFD